MYISLALVLTGTVAGCLCRNFKLRILYILDEIIIRAYLAYNILNSDIYPHSSETLRNSSYL